MVLSADWITYFNGALYVTCYGWESDPAYSDLIPNHSLRVESLKNSDPVQLQPSPTQPNQVLFSEINPMKQVPTIVDGRFKLFESHAILRYLACASPGVAHHWYPDDLFARARINSVLDWHHLNLRRGTVTLLLNTVMGSAFGLPLNPQASAEGEKILISSLAKIESTWLGGNGKFLLGSSEPSIADLSLVCEIMQLEILEEKDVNLLLGHHKKMLQWIEDTRNAMRPHFDEVHKILFEAKSRMHRQSSGQNYGTESSIKAMLLSMM